MEQIKLTIERALCQRKLAVDNRNLRDQLETTFRFESLLGRSPAVTKIFELVRKAARSDANILVQGESGTIRHGEVIRRAPTPCSRSATRGASRQKNRRVYLEDNFAALIR